MSSPPLAAAPPNQDSGLFVQVQEYPQGLIMRPADDPILHQKCTNIVYRHDQNLVTLQQDLFRKCYDLESQALTAQQVGIPLNLFVIHIRPTRFFPFLESMEPLVVRNPQIIWRSDKIGRFYETCPTTPDVFARVSRHEEIEVSFMAFTGKQERRKFNGFAACIMQHACDHLEGKPFTEQGMPTDVLTAKEYLHLLNEALKPI